MFVGCTLATCWLHSGWQNKAKKKRALRGKCGFLDGTLLRCPITSAKGWLLGLLEACLRVLLIFTVGVSDSSWSLISCSLSHGSFLWTSINLHKETVPCLSYRYPNRNTPQWGEGVKCSQKCVRRYRVCSRKDIRKSTGASDGRSKNTITKSGIIFTVRQILLGCSNKGGPDEWST
jgi:hypothetical protein